MTIMELREKRAKAWESAKAFLDSHRNENSVLSAEDDATYTRMEKDITDLGKEISRLERQEALDAELSKAVSTPLTSKPETAKGGMKTGRASDEYKKAFSDMIRKKTATNALQVGTESEGGYLVPDEFERILIQALEEENIIRKIATNITTSSGERNIPVVSTHGVASWIAEEGSYPESDDVFSQQVIGAHKVGTLVKASEELVNDSAFDIETYLNSEFARRIGAAEEAAFVAGDGSNKPTGVFTSAGAGVTAASSTAITTDELIDLFYSVKAPYRKNGSWLMNDQTIKAIRKLKDGNGQYIWTPSIIAGEPDLLFGRPLYTSASVDTIAASKKVVAFGDFKYYWVADRSPLSVIRLNELFAATGQIGFRGSKRVDGKLVLPEAVKVLTMKAGA